MKRFVLGLLLLLPLASCSKPEAYSVPRSLPLLEISFSPSGGCTEAVAKEIDAAKGGILVQAYSFTSAPIAKALVDAHKRGINVQVILDKSQRTAKYSSADFVQHAGIPAFIDAKHAIAHNKIMVIDGATVITGSFNFTKSAEENNAENLLVIRDKTIADRYTANWNDHLKHSEKYEAKDVGYSEKQASGTEANAAGRYVSSARSEVFHKANCNSAAKISAKNRVVYSTRDEAIQAGKKPCDECRP